MGTEIDIEKQKEKDMDMGFGHTNRHLGRTRQFTDIWEKTY